MLVGADGTCKITGFGLASVCGDAPIDPAQQPGPLNDR
jgi:hypothetical protein